MSSAVSDALAKARADGRAALIGYLPVGYPDVEVSIEAMRGHGRAGGADVVEIGLPYSDPVMDGPTIQAAVEPAVRAGVGVRRRAPRGGRGRRGRRRRGGHDLLEPDRALRRRPVRRRSRRRRWSGR